jgi:hypothetical protein
MILTGMVSSTLVYADSPVQSGNDQPVVVTAVAPVYPPAVDTSRGPVDIDSTIYIEVNIDKLGNVVSSRPISGHPLLQSSSQNAARQWRFAPVENEDLRTVRLAFVFTTVPKDAPDNDLATIFTSPYQVEIKHRSIAIMPGSHSRKKGKRQR